MRKGSEKIKEFRKLDIKSVTTPRVFAWRHSLFNEQRFMEISAGGKTDKNSCPPGTHRIKEKMKNEIHSVLD